jgi:hypothetical protein
MCDRQEHLTTKQKPILPLKLFQEWEGIKEMMERVNSTVCIIRNFKK